jgi:hypothetical protein
MNPEPVVLVNALEVPEEDDAPRIQRLRKRFGEIRLDSSRVAPRAESGTKS